MRPITLRVMAVMAALLVTFCRAGDDRLLDPGSAGEESPASLEVARSKKEVVAMNGKISTMKDLGESFRLHPHAAAKREREEAHNVHDELEQQRKRQLEIASAAAAAEGLYRNIAVTSQTSVESQVAQDAMFSAKLGESDSNNVRSMAGKRIAQELLRNKREDQDLGESADLSELEVTELQEASHSSSQEHNIWSYSKARWVTKAEIKREEAQARVDYRILGDSTDSMKPSHIRAEAHQIADESGQTREETAALNAEHEDEGQLQVLQRSEGSMQMKGYLALQKQRLQAIRDGESEEANKLQTALRKMRQVHKEVGAEIAEQEMLAERASSMDMMSTKEDSRDLGASMGDDSTERQFASHVADALATKLAPKRRGDHHLTAEQRGRLVATVWKEGSQMAHKEEELADANNRYRRQKADYAVRSEWDHGSLVEAYNVETGKWFRGTVLARHKKRLNIRLHHLGIEEWLPDSSKRLRIPRDAIQIQNDNGPELGQSMSGSETDSTHLSNTMTQGQVRLVEAGMNHENHNQHQVLNLVDEISQKTDSLQHFIGKHLQQKPVRDTAPNPSEYFIAKAVEPEVERPELGESVIAVPHEMPDLGEGADTGDKQITEKSLSRHESGALQEYTNHMQHIYSLDAKNEILKMSMADLEKSALQHEVIERSKVAKYAKQAGAYQQLVATSLKRLGNEKKRQLKKVNTAADAGVWSSYQASLRHREQQLTSKVKNMDKDLQQEEEFAMKVRQHAAQLVEKAAQIRHLEESAAEVATRLGEVASPDQINLKVVDQGDVKLEKATQTGIDLVEASLNLQRAEHLRTSDAN